MDFALVPRRSLKSVSDKHKYARKMILLQDPVCLHKPLCVCVLIWLQFPSNRLVVLLAEVLNVEFPSGAVHSPGEPIIGPSDFWDHRIWGLVIKYLLLNTEYHRIDCYLTVFRGRGTLLSGENIPVRLLMCGITLRALSLQTIKVCRSSCLRHRAKKAAKIVIYPKIQSWSVFQMTSAHQVKCLFAISANIMSNGKIWIHLKPMWKNKENIVLHTLSYGKMSTKGLN